MKNIFKAKFIIPFLLLIAGISIFATQRTRPTIFVNQGEFKQFGGAAADTIVVSDTLTYIYEVTHTNDVNPVINLFWDKIGAGTATCTVKFWQSMNLSGDYSQCVKGSLLSAYTKTISGSADAYYNYSFKNDTAYFDQRYLKIQFITTSTASVKAKLTGYVKFNIK